MSSAALRELHDALAEGETTGEALAARFGVTRSAVHKRIEALRDWGVDVQARAGRGYQLTQPIEWLSASRIQAALSAASRAALADLRVEDEVDSTNARLLAAQPSPQGVSVLAAERQNAGRGRRGRAWLSAPGAGLTFSVGLRVEGGIARLQGLSLAVGIALCEALRARGIANAALKWPNDVWVDDAKLAGILIEIDGDAAGPLHAVVGIGLNWRVGAAQRAGIAQAVTDACSEGVRGDRNALFAALLDSMLPLLRDYERDGFAPWRARWDAVDALHGREVVAMHGTQRIEGVALGIDDQGALRLRAAQGEHLLHGGEITVRPR